MLRGEHADVAGALGVGWTAPIDPVGCVAGPRVSYRTRGLTTKGSGVAVGQQCTVYNARTGNVEQREAGFSTWSMFEGF